MVEEREFVPVHKIVANGVQVFRVSAVEDVKCALFLLGASVRHAREKFIVRFVVPICHYRCWAQGWFCKRIPFPINTLERDTMIFKRPGLSRLGVLSVKSEIAAFCRDGN